jgi:2-desacetyl-2-hydroxyethyl bacteriochlorophyllide A dehydrogenase
VLRPATDPIVGIYSHIGPTALNGVHDAAPRVGETVAVFGLGVVGQLVAQLLRRAGAGVIGVEPIANRRDIATGLGLAHAVDPAAGDVAERVRSLTDGRGADVCVEASGSTRALHQAIRSCAYNSRVVAMGFYQGEATGLALGEEFHHARINLVSSQIGGSAPDLQGRWDRARLVRTFMGIAEGGEIACAELVTHRVPAREAATAFEMLDERPHEALQVVLDFGA